MAHDLAADPVWDLDRVAELAERFPPDDIVWGRLASRARTPTRRDDSASQTIRDIASTPGWVVFRGIGRDAQYGELVEACRVAVFRRFASSNPTQFESALIVTSPSAITPVHLDLDESFLLQLRGSKTFGLAPPSLVPSDQLRRHHAGTQTPLTLPAEARDLIEKKALHPGDGLHVPFEWPHFTKVGRDHYSISLSLAFQTDRTLMARSSYKDPEHHPTA